MTISVIFKIAAVGILVSILSQVSWLGIMSGLFLVIILL